MRRFRDDERPLTFPIGRRFTCSRGTNEPFVLDHEDLRSKQRRRRGGVDGAELRRHRAERRLLKVTDLMIWAKARECRLL